MSDEYEITFAGKKIKGGKLEFVQYPGLPADPQWKVEPDGDLEIEASRRVPPSDGAATLRDVRGWLHNQGANDIVVENGAPGTVNISMSAGCGEVAPLLIELNLYARACFAVGIAARVRCRNTYTGFVTETIVPRGDER